MPVVLRGLGNLEKTSPPQGWFHGLSRTVLATGCLLLQGHGTSVRGGSGSLVGDGAGERVPSDPS